MQLRIGKPLVSATLALALVLALVLPQISTETVAGPTTPYDIIQAGSIHWLIVGAVAALWLGVQLFWPASVETTKLGLAVSATIIWLSFLLFFNFNPPGGNFDTPGFKGGAAAFFALMGGMGIVLLWVRFLADDITF
jgi:hypothetical protein